MLFRIVFSLIYLITLEIGIAAHMNIKMIVIFVHKKRTENSFKCDFHCVSQGLIDENCQILKKIILTVSKLR